MAVEQQQGDWLFLGHAQGRRPYTVKSKSNIVKPEPEPVVHNIAKYFRLHFLHDLESLYWTYIWFLHHRVPVGSTHVDYRLAQGRGEYFYPPKRGRVNLFLNTSNSTTIWDYLEPLYPARTALLSPVSLSAEITREYVRIQQIEPEQKDGIWRLPIDCFTDNLCDDFLASLRTALQSLQSNVEPVEPVPFPGQRMSGKLASLPQPDSIVE